MPVLSVDGLYQRIRPAAAAHLGDRSPMAVPDREHLMFCEHLDMFLEGADSDAPDPTMDKMMAAIIAKAQGSPNGGGDDDDG